MAAIAPSFPQTRSQISSPRTANIKAKLRLTPEQEKNWPGFESAMSDIGKTSADRQVALQAERTQQSAQQKGPFDLIEGMRKEAIFLSERSVERKTIADAAEPLYVSLNDQQKRLFAEELSGLSRRPGDE
jgi:hypothetical protein